MRSIVSRLRSATRPADGTHEKAGWGTLLFLWVEEVDQIPVPINDAVLFTSLSCSCFCCLVGAVLSVLCLVVMPLKEDVLILDYELHHATSSD